MFYFTRLNTSTSTYYSHGLFVSSVMTYLVVFTFGKHRFDRIEGMIFLLCYVAYTAHLLLR